MAVIAKSFVYASLLAILVVSSSLFLATNYWPRATPELDVYEWAESDDESELLMYSISASSDTVADYDLFTDNITGIIWNAWEDQWLLNTKSFHGIKDTPIGPEEIEHYNTFTTNRDIVKSQFDLLKPMIKSFSEYSESLKVDFSDPKLDDWDQYEDFIIDVAGENYTKEISSHGSERRYPNQKIDPLFYLDYIGTQSDRVLVMVYEFGITIAASTAQMELENGDMVPVTREYTDGIEYGTNYGWHHGGYPSLSKGDIHSFYFIEYEFSETKQLQFISSLNQLLTGLLQ